MVVAGTITVKMAPAREALGADARAEVVHRDGLVRDLGRLLPQPLLGDPGHRHGDPRRRVRAGLPAEPRGAHARPPAPAGEDQAPARGRAARRPRSTPRCSPSRSPRSRAWATPSATRRSARSRDVPRANARRPVDRDDERAEVDARRRGLPPLVVARRRRRADFEALLAELGVDRLPQGRAAGRAGRAARRARAPRCEALGYKQLVYVVATHWRREDRREGRARALRGRLRRCAPSARARASRAWARCARGRARPCPRSSGSSPAPTGRSASSGTSSGSASRATRICAA